MNKLYDKIYEAVNTGIQKALIISDDQSQDTSIQFHNKEITSEFIPYEYRTVDLNLPSGLLWCEYNLGAYPDDNPEDWYGDYYSWGETEIKHEYSKNTYTLKKYRNTDTLVNLTPEYDIVRKTLGTEYSMPTEQHCRELIDNTTQKWVKNYNNIYGLNGILFISENNGKTLFCPAAGYYGYKDGTENYRKGDLAGIWSATVDIRDKNNACCLCMSSDLYSHADIYHDWCYFGWSIRGIKIIK